MAEKILEEMFEICAVLASISPEILRSQGTNIAINNGEQHSGRPDEHLSIDFAPRWLGDISFLSISNRLVITLDMVKLLLLVKKN